MPTILMEHSSIPSLGSPAPLHNTHSALDTHVSHAQIGIQACHRVSTIGSQLSPCLLFAAQTTPTPCMCGDEPHKQRGSLLQPPRPDKSAAAIPSDTSSLAKSVRVVSLNRGEMWMNSTIPHFCLHSKFHCRPEASASSRYGFSASYQCECHIPWGGPHLASLRSASCR